MARLVRLEHKFHRLIQAVYTEDVSSIDELPTIQGGVVGTTRSIMFYFKILKGVFLCFFFFTQPPLKIKPL